MDRAGLLQKLAVESYYQQDQNYHGYSACLSNRPQRDATAHDG
jgi:hypothetical protein